MHLPGTTFCKEISVDIHCFPKRLSAGQGYDDARNTLRVAVFPTRFRETEHAVGNICRRSIFQKESHPFRLYIFIYIRHYMYMRAHPCHIVSRKSVNH